jgi:hypothetical protein
MFIEWFPTKTCVVVSKEGVSILYMDFNYVSPSNEGRHIVDLSRKKKMLWPEQENTI